jgi:hypothetical protein
MNQSSNRPSLTCVRHVLGLVSLVCIGFTTAGRAGDAPQAEARKAERPIGPWRAFGRVIWAGDGGLLPAIPLAMPGGD